MKLAMTSIMQSLVLLGHTRFHFCSFPRHFLSFLMSPLTSRSILNLFERSTFYPQKLALTSPTSDGRSVCIVHSRTQATEFYVSLQAVFREDNTEQKYKYETIHIYPQIIVFVFVFVSVLAPKISRCLSVTGNISWCLRPFYGILHVR
jgi:hypothetical protein